ncbi:MAG: asparaginase, partial [Candidatus Eremiobacteraeota bacterium]|nr:asparaginase [Candidatus Eremiobacteraeota bacterium]
MQSSTPRSSSLSPDGAALAGEPLVDVFRGARLESRHHVAACAVDARGTVLFRLGTVDVPVFLRSSAKPFIAGAVVRGGAADAFGFDARDLALISASHGGEPGHIEGVRAILRKAGVEESALRCGAHPPLHEPSAQALSARCEQPTAIHNNCSGKHAGILALAKHLGADLATYLEAGNPAQREILALCERVVGERFEGDRLAVDGCGIPVFATT